MRHFIPTRIAIVKKMGNNKCCSGCGEMRTFIIDKGNIKACNYFGNSLVVLQKVYKHKVTIGLNSTSYMPTTNGNMFTQKNTWMFIAALFILTKL